MGLRHPLETEIKALARMNETPHLVPISVFSFANIRLHVEYCKFRPIKLFYHDKLFNWFGQPYNVPRVSIRGNL